MGELSRARSEQEETFWTPPAAMFRGATVFCLGSGPSLTYAVAERLRGRNAIAVNSSCIVAPWAPMLFFTDESWFLGETREGVARRDIVANWPGQVFSTSRGAKRRMPEKINRIRGIIRRDFPPAGSPIVRQGVSSGHTAVSVLVACGASRIILVGFDMRSVDGKEHCHDEYQGPRALDVYEDTFIPGFAGWYEDGLKVGAKILNATPDSALQEFPLIELKEVL